MFKVVLESQRNVRSNFQHPFDYQKSNRVLEKSSISALLTMPKLSTVWIKTNCGKFWKRWGYEAHWLASWVYRSGAAELDMEQRTGSKTGKKYVKAVYCHPAYLTYMQSTSREMLGWKKHKLDLRLLGEISITSGMQVTPPLWQKVKRN